MLSIDQLGFRYRRRFLFRRLSFTVEPGQLWHIKGPNGCGKSTLMGLLTGRLEPSEGEVAYLNEDYKSQFEYLAAEQNALFGELSAWDNLRFWLQWKGARTAAQLDEAMGRTLEAWGFRNRLVVEDFPVATFSTGMKRKLALIRVALSGSPLWLLDEPLYGLDADATAVFRQTLMDHCSGGGAVVAVSHDMSAFTDLSAGMMKTLDLKGYTGEPTA